LDAYWINERSREDAIAKGYTVVDHATIMTTHISDVVRRYAHELIGRQEAQHLLDALKQNYPKVVEELVPNHLSLGGVVKVLQNLLMEQVSIRDLLTIVETLADWAPSTRQLDVLTEYVRQSLSRSITSQYLSSDGNLMVVTLGPSAERRMAESIQRSEHGDFLTVDPHYAQKLMRRLADRMEKFTPLNLQPILICSAQIRYHFKKMADRFLPHLVVLSYEEIAPTIKIQSLGVVETTDED
jgi:flagellar biosynthesis protein FlhA